MKIFLFVELNLLQLKYSTDISMQVIPNFYSLGWPTHTAVTYLIFRSLSPSISINLCLFPSPCFFFCCFFSSNSTLLLPLFTSLFSLDIYYDFNKHLFSVFCENHIKKSSFVIYVFLYFCISIFLLLFKVIKIKI